MPLEVYRRGKWWWVRGRIDRLPESPYYRQSLEIPSTLPEAEARRIATDLERAEERRAILGEERSLTFAEAILLYPAKPADAGFLERILPHLGKRSCASITPLEVRALGPVIYPNASTDTWQRQVVTPIRSVINNAHDLGKCPPIRIAGYKQKDRLQQDKARGKQSRAERKAGDLDWVMDFRAAAFKHLKKPRSFRFAALALFLFSTGARISQAVALMPDDIDNRNNRVKLSAWAEGAKGHEDEWVDLPAELIAELCHLVALNGGARRKKAPVFGYHHRWGIYKPWNHVVSKAKIEKLSPHEAGRHGLGTELLVRQGLDAATVARLGRWANPETPLKFYAHGDSNRSAINAMISTKLVQAGHKKSA